MQDREYSRKPRSLFWPVILIGIGVIFLLVNLGYIPQFNVFWLLRLWPILLIVLGLEIIIGRRSPIISAFIGLLAVGAVLALLFYGQNFGLFQNPQAKTEQFTVLAEGVKSEKVYLDLAYVSTDISPVKDSKNLVDMNIAHHGEVVFTSQGTTDKTIRLDRRNFTSFWTDFGLFNLQPWEIGLSPSVPLDLTVDSGSGSVDMDLAEMDLTNLDVDSGSGSLRASLPAANQFYKARINSSSGSLNVKIAKGADVELHLDGGSGSINVDVPDDAAVRVELRDDGSGSFNVPSNLDKVSGRGDDDDEGVYQTGDYESASQKINIVVDDQGSGSISIN